MEYFDFDEASYDSQSLVREDDIASDKFEIDEGDAAANYNSFLQDEPIDFSNDPPNQGLEEHQLVDVPNSLLDNGVYPMRRAREPCDFCRHMNLDCFVAKSGVMRQSGCTCCISLWRECSFTKQVEAPGRFLDTLHPIAENIDNTTGGLTGKKALKSHSYIAEEADGQSRKSNSRLSREAVRILKTWLLDHSAYPYPTDQEKDELKQRTGLKRTQICNWLANARRRGKVRAPPRSSSPAAPGAVDIPGQQQRRDVATMTPLERWKHSPPENEPAATSDIIRALNNTSLDPERPRSFHPGHVRSHSRKTGSSNDSSHDNSNLFNAPSVSSHETSQSASRSSLSDLSFASAFSHRSSLGSFGSMERKERRRRRKPSLPVNPFNQQKTRNARIFQCTFCTDTFQTKYDWQRHEKSLHLALEKWTCSPLGGVAFIGGAHRCVFCMAIDPDMDHLESHNYSACQEKTSAERSFYRKDHLNQHLRLMHNVKFLSSMDAWRSSITELKSRCGFCGISLSTWKDRVDHLASHFKNGSNMTQWRGDWGFEPFILGLVENAMPPYLIGHDQKTLNPFKPSSAAGKAPGLVVAEDANCFIRLKHELTAFVHNQVAAGVVPSDQMIQDEARMIIYGTDDRWHQTCADNPVWLSFLKRDTGLEVVPGSDHIQLSDLGMQPPFATTDGLRQPPVETNLLARSACRSQQPFSPMAPPSGFHSPALPGTSRSSVPASAPGSSIGSYAENSGTMLIRPQSGLSSDWGSSVSAGPTAFSTPLSASVDPFVQMGFDPEFLQQLNSRYDEMPLEELQGLGFGGDGGNDNDFISHEHEAQVAVSTAQPLAPSKMASAPIPIPSPKQNEVYMSDAGPDPNHSLAQDLYFSGRNV
ncbi:hypothetical protein BP00DRAFT_431159 [Aspergillus indologenus CBS 114.80]|uniref:Homeobox and C2H2 transcription factor n=1 Tax=Aspergillus indologenus CBS 114.80 TaxID=1450541 RepID=A0A2V5IYJ1_9EURO|nr:hypothetical protein BP00DRAFT_431159 [Aspergillus indologenus CBS 114.80]